MFKIDTVFKHVYNINSLYKIERHRAMNALNDELDIKSLSFQLELIANTLNMIAISIVRLIRILLLRNYFTLSMEKASLIFKANVFP